MSAPTSSKAAAPPAAPGAWTTELRIGGFVALSGCDWPGELVATVFCQGCPWDCAYCHNAHLQATGEAADGGAGFVSWLAVLGVLRSRVGLLDGLVFSGGEPTLQRDLLAAMQQVRALGFRVGLHTAGPYPDRLAAVLPLVDWVGFDVKAPFADYTRVTGVPHSGERARDSLRQVLASGVAYEVRTTVHPALLDRTALHGLADALAEMGVQHYALQEFQAAGCRNDALRNAPVAMPFLPDRLSARFATMVVRTGASHDERSRSDLLPVAS